MSEIFHKGELEVQKQVGEHLMASSVGRIITNTIPAGAINFIEKQPLAIACSTDSTDNVWVSLLIGDFGFVKVPNPNSISFDKKKIYSSSIDIIYKNLEIENSTIGTLFIELSTRIRFRINGRVSINNDEIKVAVEESYPNCPKYIQQRIISDPKPFKNTEAVNETGVELNEHLTKWITSADTFFIGSKSDSNKLDASHRGGNKGFIELKDGVLKIPDYKGNSLYNTLGNIHQNSKAGLLFIDFEKGNTLQLSGTSQVLFNQNTEEDMTKTGGTGRYLLFSIEQWIKTENHHDVDWEFLSNSPYNP